MMAGNLTNYAAGKLLEHSLGRTSWTMPSAVYGGLFTETPTDTTPGTEIAGNGYTREAITWNVQSGGTITNNATVTFGPATGTWGTIVALGVFDAPSGGNLIWYGPLTVSRTILNADSLQWAATKITITLD